MKIAINAHLLDSKERSGIPNYILNLIISLAKIDDKNEYYIFSNFKIIEQNILLEKRRNYKIIKSAFPLRNSISRILWEQIWLPYHLNKIKPDVFHNPDHILPFLPIKCRKIITVHDLAFIKFPKAFTFGKRLYKKLMIKNAVSNADRIIADSQNTKKDIVDEFKINPQKIKVIYSGINEAFRQIDNGIQKEKIIKKYNINLPFMLFVGKLEPRKNVAVLINAFSLFLKRNKSSHNLLIVGEKGWMFEDIFKTVNELNLCDKVKFLFNVQNDDLPIIYNLADLFVYPSLYEGFGFPPLEAMACGIPVITSNVSSLPEIAGDAAMLVDPNSIEQISNAICEVLSSNNLKQDLVRRGLERAKIFSWEKCALETLKMYQETNGKRLTAHS